MINEKIKQFKQAVSGDVYKFEKIGDSISGIFISIEESKMYPNSYALKIKNPAKENPTVIFVSGIVLELIRSNNIQSGMDIMIEYAGKKKSTKSGMEYHDYKVFYV